ncbi:MAG: PPOX class F420-dependent oxidoreductase [Ilumatobacteraceae bacterium]|jgi:PPOX class probable F420-dependent enzyme
MNTSNISAVRSAKYISFVSTRKNGTPIATPVWVAPLDYLGPNVFGFTIDANAGKAKRLAHTSAVTVQPCDIRGRTTEGSPIIAGQAVVISGTEAEKVRDAIAAKYGFTYTVFSIYLWVSERFGKSKDQPETAVVVTLDA